MVVSMNNFDPQKLEVLGNHFHVSEEIHSFGHEITVNTERMVIEFPFSLETLETLRSSGCITRMDNFDLLTLANELENAKIIKSKRYDILIKFL